MLHSFAISTVHDVNRAHSLVVDCLQHDKKHLFEIKPYVESRSLAQNRLQHHWYNELERQSQYIDSIKGFSIDDIRSKCKLHFGVPIMQEDPEFAAVWELAVGHLQYEDQLRVVFYMPVTRIMNVEQKTRFLNNVYYHWTPQGAILTTSADFYYEAMGWTR